MFSNCLEEVLWVSEGRKGSDNEERKTEDEGEVGCLRWVSQWTKQRRESRVRQRKGKTLHF